jgi:hypothetical protein
LVELLPSSNFDSSGGVIPNVFPIKNRKVRAILKELQIMAPPKESLRRTPAKHPLNALLRHLIFVVDTTHLILLVIFSSINQSYKVLALDKANVNNNIKWRE